MLKLTGINLNLGCGTNKTSCCINVDLDLSFKPDLVFNLKHPFPIKSSSVDRVFLVHVIEHLEECLHYDLLSDIYRILKFGGLFFVSYPEFVRCAQNYIDNTRGKREFWKHTIFGRQAHKSDYHYSLMNTDDLVDLLQEIGFENIKYKEELDKEVYNTMLVCYKGNPKMNWEDVLRQEIFENGTNSNG